MADSGMVPATNGNNSEVDVAARAALYVRGYILLYSKIVSHA